MIWTSKKVYRRGEKIDVHWNFPPSLPKGGWFGLYPHPRRNRGYVSGASYFYATKRKGVNSVSISYTVPGTYELTYSVHSKRPYILVAIGP